MDIDQLATDADGVRSSGICHPSFAGLVVLAGSQYPIPSRTRPLNSPAPMVLSLKAWKSRSLPGLPRTETLFTIVTGNQPPQAFLRRLFVFRLARRAPPHSSRRHAVPGNRISGCPIRIFSPSRTLAHSVNPAGANRMMVDPCWNQPISSPFANGASHAITRCP